MIRIWIAWVIVIIWNMWKIYLIHNIFKANNISIYAKKSCQTEKFQLIQFSYFKWFFSLCFQEVLDHRTNPKQPFFTLPLVFFRWMEYKGLCFLGIDFYPLKMFQMCCLLDIFSCYDFLRWSICAIFINTLIGAK